LERNRCFGGTCRLHLQSQRIIQARKHRESRWKVEMLRLFFNPERGGDIFHRNVVDFQRTALRFLTEEGTLLNQSFKYLKFLILKCFKSIKLVSLRLKECYSLI
jgi:hypothetical protein